MKAAIVTALSLTLIAACKPPSTIEVRRSALVPAAVPIDRTGAGMGQSLLEGYIGSEGFATRAARESDRDAGVSIPAGQYRGGMRFRIPGLESLDFGFSYLHVPGRGATSVSELPPPEGDGHGLSTAVHAHLPLGDDGFRVGFAGEVSFYSLPFTIYERCVADCRSTPFTELREGRAVVPGLGVAIIPNYRIGAFTIHGQLTARTHPSIDRIDYITEYDLNSGGPEVGPFVMMFGGGVEVDLPRGFRLGVRGHVVTAAPADYAPSFGATLTIPLVREAPAAVR